MKKKLLAFLLGTSLVFSLAACGGGDKAADKSSDTSSNSGTETASNSGGEDGQAIFNKSNCSSCHGQNLEGMGDAFPNLQKVGSRLSKDEIKQVILNGRNQMPAQNVSEEEATKLAEWLAAKK